MDTLLTQPGQSIQSSDKPPSALYFQFELSLLSFAPTEPVEDRLRAIIRYCLLQVGAKIVKNKTKAERLEILNLISNSAQWPVGFNKDKKEHLAILWGFRAFNLFKGDCARIIADYQRCAEHVARMENLQGGPSPLVRLRDDFIWDAIKGSGLSWRELCVLCAVYSAIGAHSTPWRITRSAIRARAAGFKSDALLFDKAEEITPAGRELLAKLGCPDPLTTDQIRWTLGVLDGHYFARRHVSPRCTYFSNRMTREEIAKWFKQHPRRKAKLAQFRAEDAALRAELSGMPIIAGSVATTSPIIVGSNSTQSPPSPREIPTRVPASVPTEIETLNRNQLIQKEVMKLGGAVARPATISNSSDDVW